MFSQTAEYALRAMVCLASASEELVPTQELARQTGVPSNYLAKVLQMLASTDLIVGRRGVGGGYRLARPASEIRLLDVIEAVSPQQRGGEGKGFGVGSSVRDENERLALLHGRMADAAEAVKDIFSRTTLDEVAVSAVEGEPRGGMVGDSGGVPAASRQSPPAAS